MFTKRSHRGIDSLAKALVALVVLVTLAAGGSVGNAIATALALSILMLAVVGGMKLVQLLNLPPKSEIQRRRIELVAVGQPSNAEIGLALDDLDWFQLEKLVAVLFKAKGNAVEMRGGANADGGIDLVVDSGTTKAAVQCKHWSKWKCGSGVVRELIGAMKHEGFSQGFLVCRTATDAAVQLANQERITIVDREGLIERIDAAIDADNEDVRRLLFAPDKLCPKCGAQMILRIAAKGSNVGSEFWGCSKYPDCRQTMRV